MSSIKVSRGEIEKIKRISRSIECVYAKNKTTKTKFKFVIFQLENPNF
jgi:hypothetical protein